MPTVRFRDQPSRFGRLGKLHKGSPKGTNRPGEDLEFFRFTSERPEFLTAFEAAYGPQPARFDRVFLPHVSVADNFSDWQELWAGGGLVHRCDGQLLHDYRVDEGRMQHDDVPHIPCPYYSGELHRTVKEPGCKLIGRLELFLPELFRAGYVGTVTLETHSAHDVGHILGVLRATMEQRRGHVEGLRGIEFSLWRELADISMFDDKLNKQVRRKKWLCKLAPAVNWVQMRLALASAEAMGGEGVDKQTQQGTNTAQRGGDTGPPPSSAVKLQPSSDTGRKLTVKIMSFGKPILTAGVTTDTFDALLAICPDFEKIAGKDSALTELRDSAPDAWVWQQDKGGEWVRRYTRMALTEPEGRKMLAHFQTVVKGVQRGASSHSSDDPGPPPDDDRVPDSWEVP